MRPIRKSCGWMTLALASGLAFAFASNAAAQLPLPANRTLHHAKVSGKHYRSFTRDGVGLAYAGRPNSRRHGTGYADLVGSPQGGFGFYALPYQYRVAAWRHHMRELAAPNAVLFAMGTDSARYNYLWTSPIHAYRYGVYDPYEGVGTPFFAGYYGPADDTQPSQFPFGTPYSR